MHAPMHTHTSTHTPRWGQTFWVWWWIESNSDSVSWKLSKSIESRCQGALPSMPHTISGNARQGKQQLFHKTQKDLEVDYFFQLLYIISIGGMLLSSWTQSMFWNRILCWLYDMRVVLVCVTLPSSMDLNSNSSKKKGCFLIQKKKVYL